MRLPIFSWRAAALTVLCVAVFVGVVLLAVPLWLPIGISYSDIYMYSDAAYRLESGQVPHRDFFLPAGLLPFVAFEKALLVFPSAQLVLAAQLPYLLMLAPALGVIIMKSRRPLAAAATTIFFVILSLAPINWGEVGFSDAGAIDGFGVYNRSSGMVLYVVCAAIWLNVERRAAACVIAYLLVILWFTKLPAYAGALILLVPGCFMAGFNRRNCFIIVVGAMLGPLLQLFTIPSLGDYMQDFFMLAKSNGRAMHHRLFWEVFYNLPAVSVFGLVGVLSLWLERAHFSAASLRSGSSPPSVILRTLMAGESVNFATLVAIAFIIESQATGSQAYAFVTPALLAMVSIRNVPKRVALSRMVLGVSFPLLFSGTIFMRLAAMISPPRQVFGSEFIGRFGVAATADEIGIATQLMKQPSSLIEPMPREVASQMKTEVKEIVYLLSLEEGVAAFHRWREQNPTVRIETLGSLDFVDPLPKMLDLAPIRGLPIVFDSDRNIPRSLIPKLNERWAAADAILVRRSLGINESLIKMARPTLDRRQHIALTPCWDLYLRDGSVGSENSSNQKRSDGEAAR